MGGQGHPGRILEVRHGIDKLYADALLSGLFKGFVSGNRDHAGTVHRNVYDPGPVRCEGVERTGVRRTLAQDRVALVQKDLADEVETLLGTGGDEDVLLVGARALSGHHVDDDVLYTFEPRGRAVLQSLGAIGGHVVGDLAERLLAEGPGVGEAASERDDARPRQSSHEVAGRRALHSLDPVGIQEVEAVEIYERQMLSLISAVRVQGIPWRHGFDVVPSKFLREYLPELGREFEATHAAAPTPDRKYLQALDPGGERPLVCHGPHEVRSFDEVIFFQPRPKLGHVLWQDHRQEDVAGGRREHTRRSQHEVELPVRVIASERHFFENGRERVLSGVFFEPLPELYELLRSGFRGGRDLRRHVLPQLARELAREDQDELPGVGDDTNLAVHRLEPLEARHSHLAHARDSNIRVARIVDSVAWKPCS